MPDHFFLLALAAGWPIRTNGFSKPRNMRVPQARMRISDASSGGLNGPEWPMISSVQPQNCRLICNEIQALEGKAQHKRRRKTITNTDLRLSPWMK